MSVFIFGVGIGVILGMVITLSAAWMGAVGRDWDELARQNDGEDGC